MGRYTDSITGKRKAQRYGNVWITKTRRPHLTHTRLSLGEAVYLYAKNKRPEQMPPLVPPAKYWDSVTFEDEEVTTPEWQKLIDLHKSGSDPDTIDAHLESMGIMVGFFDADDMDEISHVVNSIIPIDPGPFLEMARHRDG